MSIADNIAAVQETIRSACARAHHSPDSVHLIAVTKTVSLENVQVAITAGITDIGENKAQEMATKFPLVSGVTKHFIGHLQSNKAALVVEHCDWIQSVDSLKLLEIVETEAAKQAKQMKVLLEVNFYSHMPDVERTGFKPEDVRGALEAAQKLKHVSIQGFMTIPLPDLSEADTRHVFRSLRILRDAEERQLGIKLPELSMGMSDDYPLAIEEGATMVRVGRAIFGER